MTGLEIFMLGFAILGIVAILFPILYTEVVGYE